MAFKARHVSFVLVAVEITPTETADVMSLMPLWVEECLRHVSPVQLTKPRCSTETSECGRPKSIACQIRPAVDALT
jgi:hypothetical protein